MIEFLKERSVSLVVTLPLALSAGAVKAQSENPSGILVPYKTTEIPLSEGDNAMGIARALRCINPTVVYNKGEPAVLFCPQIPETAKKVLKHQMTPGTEI